MSLRPVSGHFPNHYIMLHKQLLSHLNVHVHVIVSPNLQTMKFDYVKLLSKMVNNENVMIDAPKDCHRFMQLTGI